MLAANFALVSLCKMIPPVATLCRIACLTLVAICALPVGRAACADRAQQTRLATNASAFATSPRSERELRMLTDAADGRFDQHTLMEAALVASGIESEAAWQRNLTRYERLILALRPQVARAPSPRAKAEAVFHFMHEQVLTGGYHREASDLDELFRNGRFNCVSSAVLFACLAQQCGLDVQGVELPGHVLCRIRTARENLVIETTCDEWFRVLDDPSQRARLVRETTGYIADHSASRREVSSVELIALLYYNRGVENIQRGDFTAAIRANTAALRLDPNSEPAQANLVTAVNNWAIELCRQKEFAQSAELLRAAATLAPDRREIDSNTLHVYQSWVNSLCERGEFLQAFDLLQTMHKQQPGEPYYDQKRFDVVRRHLLSLSSVERIRRAGQHYRNVVADDPKIADLEAAAVNRLAVALAEEAQYEPSIATFDQGLRHLPKSNLLTHNRVVMVMRWAEESFDQNDYAEAVRRMRGGRTETGFDPRLAKNLRYGYQQWLEVLQQQGDTARFEAVLAEARKTLPGDPLWNRGSSRDVFTTAN